MSKENEVTLRQIVRTAERMSPGDQQRLLDMARGMVFMLERQQAEDKTQNAEEAQAATA